MDYRTTMKLKRPYAILPCRRCIILPMCMCIFDDWYVYNQKHKDITSYNIKCNQYFFFKELKSKCSLINEYVRHNTGHINITKFSRMIDYFFKICVEDKTNKDKYKHHENKKNIH
jgi:hypothetical protein